MNTRALHLALAACLLASASPQFSFRAFGSRPSFGSSFGRSSSSNQLSSDAKPVSSSSQSSIFSTAGRSRILNSQADQSADDDDVKESESVSSSGPVKTVEDVQESSSETPAQSSSDASSVKPATNPSSSFEPRNTLTSFFARSRSKPSFTPPSSSLLRRPSFTSTGSSDSAKTQQSFSTAEGSSNKQSLRRLYSSGGRFNSNSNSEATTERSRITTARTTTTERTTTTVRTTTTITTTTASTTTIRSTTTTKTTTTTAVTTTTSTTTASTTTKAVETDLEAIEREHTRDLDSDILSSNAKITEASDSSTTSGAILRRISGFSFPRTVRKKQKEEENVLANVELSTERNVDVKPSLIKIKKTSASKSASGTSTGKKRIVSLSLLRNTSRKSSSVNKPAVEKKIEKEVSKTDEKASKDSVKDEDFSSSNLGVLKRLKLPKSTAQSSNPLKTVAKDSSKLKSTTPLPTTTTTTTTASTTTASTARKRIVSIFSKPSDTVFNKPTDTESTQRSLLKVNKPVNSNERTAPKVVPETDVPALEPKETKVASGDPSTSEKPKVTFFDRKALKAKLRTVVLSAINENDSSSSIEEKIKKLKEKIVAEIPDEVKEHIEQTEDTFKKGATRLFSLGSGQADPKKSILPVSVPDVTIPEATTAVPFILSTIKPSAIKPAESKPSAIRPLIIKPSTTPVPLLVSTTKPPATTIRIVKAKSNKKEKGKSEGVTESDKKDVKSPLQTAADLGKKRRILTLFSSRLREKISKEKEVKEVSKESAVRPPLPREDPAKVGKEIVEVGKSSPKLEQGPITDDVELMIKQVFSKDPDSKTSEVIIPVDLPARTTVNINKSKVKPIKVTGPPIASQPIEAYSKEPVIRTFIPTSKLDDAFYPQDKAPVDHIKDDVPVSKPVKNRGSGFFPAGSTIVAGSFSGESVRTASFVPGSASVVRPGSSIPEAPTSSNRFQLVQVENSAPQSYVGEPTFSELYDYLPSSNEPDKVLPLASRVLASSGDAPSKSTISQSGYQSVDSNGYFIIPSSRQTIAQEQFAIPESVVPGAFSVDSSRVVSIPATPNRFSSPDSRPENIIAEVFDSRARVTDLPRNSNTRVSAVYNPYNLNPYQVISSDGSLLSRVQQTIPETIVPGSFSDERSRLSSIPAPPRRFSTDDSRADSLRNIGTLGSSRPTLTDIPRTSNARVSTVYNPYEVDPYQVISSDGSIISQERNSGSFGVDGIPSVSISNPQSYQSSFSAVQDKVKYANFDYDEQGNVILLNSAGFPIARVPPGGVISSSNSIPSDLGADVEITPVFISNTDSGQRRVTDDHTQQLLRHQLEIQRILNLQRTTALG